MGDGFMREELLNKAESINEENVIHFASREKKCEKRGDA